MDLAPVGIDVGLGGFKSTGNVRAAQGAPNAKQNTREPVYSNHYSDATWLPWRLKSTANRMFVQ